MTRRSPGDGAIYFEASRNRWVGSIDLGRGGDGKRRRRKVSRRTRPEVVAALRQLRAQAEAGLPVASGSITFGELLDQWLEKGPGASADSPNTREQYRWAVECHLRPCLGHIRLRQLRAEDIERFLIERSTFMARSSVTRLRSHAARALRWAERRDLVARNVARLAELPPSSGGDAGGRSLTRDEARHLLKAASSHRYCHLVTVTLLLGLRPGEALGLRWSDVEFDDRTVTIRQTLKREYVVENGVRHEVLLFGPPKTKKSVRCLAMPEQVVEAMRRQKSVQAGERLAAGAWAEYDLVFSTSLGTPINPSNFRRELRTITRRAGLGDWHPNELRHSAASLLSAEGVPQHEVADLLGHVDGRMLDRHYRHRIDNAVTAGAAPMEHLFGDFGTLSG